MLQWDLDQPFINNFATLDRIIRTDYRLSDRDSIQFLRLLNQVTPEIVTRYSIINLDNVSRGILKIQVNGSKYRQSETINLTPKNYLIQWVLGIILLIILWYLFD